MSSELRRKKPPGDLVSFLGLAEQTLYTTLFTLEQGWLFFQASLLRTALVQELVVIVAPPAGDLPRSRDLESFRRGLVCLQL